MRVRTSLAVPSPTIQSLRGRGARGESVDEHNILESWKPLIRRLFSGAGPPAFLVTLGYIVTGIAWIALSDRALARFISDPQALTVAQTYKGVAFVLFTAVCLYLVLWGAFWLRDRVLRTKQRELQAAYEETIEGWARTLGLRDHETEGHARRVTDMTVHLAQRMGVRRGELLHIWRGALLHDIGKIGIPDRILLKRGTLTAEEMREMRRHPEYALKLLAPIKYLRPSLDIPYCHHEHWNGSGYPRGLKGEEIPLAARIFAVVDAWDALRSERPYRQAWSESEVRQHLLQRAGIDFDPTVVATFMELLDEGAAGGAPGHVPELRVIDGALSA